MSAKVLAGTVMDPVDSTLAGIWVVTDKSKSVADESVMIGDSYEADIIGSLAVGMNAIHYINFGEKHHNKCLIVNNLLSIKDIL